MELSQGLQPQYIGLVGFPKDPIRALISERLKLLQNKYPDFADQYA